MKYRDKSAINPHDQKGAALLAFMLIMITGASFILISKMNKERIDRENITETYRALERAKQSLIAYALTVPERSGAGSGPGYLPCPDRDVPGSQYSGFAGQGNPGGSCSLGGGTSFGRLPWVTLDISDSFDDSGERLWYVVADNYRNNPPTIPLNSDTPGDLLVDGQTDIVAVIIAPGSALSQLGQDRAADFNDIANYLENDNQDGNNSFISFLAGADSSTFNDRVLALTRQEVMSAVEKRVLGEVNLAYNAYRNSFGAGNESYPWLSPFTNPNPPNPFNGIPGTSTGHLPVHIIDPNINYIDNATTSFSIDWTALNGGATVYTGIMTDDVCLRNSVCTDSNNYFDFPPFINAPNIVTPIPGNDVNCTWSDQNSFSCSSIVGIDLGFVCWPSLFPSNCGNVTRTYSINYSDDGSNITTNAPTAALTRTRGLSVNGNFADQLTIQFSDVNNSAGDVVIGTATLTIDPADPGGTMNITGVDYHLDTTGIDLNADGDYIDAGEAAPELPPWFINNNWHHLVYVAYPASEPIPGIFNTTAPASGPGICNANCLTLTATVGGNVAQVNTNVRALAVTAGQDLSVASPRPNAFLTDYFDIDNSNLDLVYDKQMPSVIFNDQIRILLTTVTP